MSLINKKVVNLGVGPFSRVGFAVLSIGGLVFANAMPVLAQQEALLGVSSDVSAISPQVDGSLADEDLAKDNRLVLSLRSRTVYLYQGDVLLSSYPVAVGTAATPTPQGEFTVSKMVENPIWQSPWTGEIHEPGPNSALGLRWIEFTSTDAGAFGFHGTPTVDSIGYAASNGCVRMYNEDVVALFSQVRVGTPVSILP